jgi:hypothetical protein
VSRSFGAQGTKGGQILNRDIVARQMQHGILQRTGVAIGQDEAIAIDPRRIRRTVRHSVGPQDVRHGRAAHGSAGMARIGRLRLIRRNGADRIDTALLQIFRNRSRHGKDTGAVTGT